MLLIFISATLGHGAIISPRSRNSVDYLVGVNAPADWPSNRDCTNITGGACNNGQADFWYSQGCFIGCGECDHTSGRRQVITWASILLLHGILRGWVVSYTHFQTLILPLPSLLTFLPGLVIDWFVRTWHGRDNQWPKVSFSKPECNSRLARRHLQAQSVACTRLGTVRLYFFFPSHHWHCCIIVKKDKELGYTN